MSVISQIGIAKFVDTLGAILAPLYGILIADFYIVQKRRLDLPQLFSDRADGRYFYEAGWNRNAIIAVGVAALFSIATVWLPSMAALTGFGWLIGAALGGVIHILLARR